MALTDKNIVITPNIGAAADPKLVFSGADAATAAQNITLTVYPTNGGTLSFDGSTGQLFSVTNSMSGTIFSANDVSGIPSIEVIDTGLVKIAQYSGNVLLGSATDNGVNKLQVAGTASIVASGGATTTPNTALILDYESNATSMSGGGTAIEFRGKSSGGNISNYQQARIRSVSYDNNNSHGIAFDYKPDAGTSFTEGFRLTNAGTVTIGSNTALHAGNYTSYSPTLTGGSASGTWGISITGNAATVTSVTPSNFASQTAATVLASPTLAAGVPTFRTLTLEDIPDAWVKKSVVAATTSNITLLTTLTIDGISLLTGDRVLVKNQTAAETNGIYIVSTGAWTRALDADTSSKIAGALVNVDKGTVNGGAVYDSNFKSTDTLGTTAMSWNKLVDANSFSTYLTDTLAAVTGRGATTATASTFSGGLIASGSNAITLSNATTNNITSGTDVSTFIRTRSSSTASTGGVSLFSGDSTFATGSAGWVSVNPGSSNAATGANLSLFGGNVTAATSTAGYVYIRGGAAASTANTAGTGGNVYIVGGFANATAGTKVGGSVWINGGLPINAGTNTAGNVNIGTGSAGFTDAILAGTVAINIGTSTNTTTVNGTVKLPNVGTSGFVKLGAGGQLSADTTVLTSSNYTSYSPTLTGGSASGTWGINITGNAATATNVSAFKNRIINGNMVIDQRNAGAAKTINGGTGYAGSAYTLDRWVAFSAGGTGATFTAQRVTAGYGVYDLKLTVTAINSGTVLGVYQRIEGNNTNDLTSATVTLSASVYCDTAQTVTWIAYIPTSLDTWTGPGLSSGPSTNATAVATGTWSVGTSSAIYTATFALDTNAPKGLQILIQRVPTAINQTLVVGKVQLEKGSTATTFDYRPYGLELSMCQRYCEQLATGISSTTLGPGIGWAWAAGQVEVSVPFLVVKRATPTVVLGGTVRFIGASGAPDQSLSMTLGAISTRNIHIYNPSTSGWSSNQTMRVMETSTTSILVSAEL